MSIVSKYQFIGFFLSVLCTMLIFSSPAYARGDRGSYVQGDHDHGVVHKHKNKHAKNHKRAEYRDYKRSRHAIDYRNARYKNYRHREDRRVEHRDYDYPKKHKHKHKGKHYKNKHAKYHFKRDSHIKHYPSVVIIKPYGGRRYHGYGHYYHDRDAYKWLALRSITLGILDRLSVRQQRTHEHAQIAATTVRVGEVVRWNEGRASGSVSVIKDGTSDVGNYCREFRQTVTIGGRSEKAYGTACRQPDGAWEVIGS